MLCFPLVDIPQEHRTLANPLRFVIGDKIYILGDDGNGWKMKCLDTKTFSMSSLRVRFGEDDGKVLNFDHACVHKEKAYIWNYQNHFLCEGALDADGFRWHRRETTGSRPPMGLSFSYKDVASSQFCVLTQASANHLSLYRLNLESMKWSTTELIITNQVLLHLSGYRRIAGIFDTPEESISGWSACTFHHTKTSPEKPFGENINALAKCGMLHVLILDLLTLEWSVGPAVNEQDLPSSDNRVVVSNDHHLLMIGKQNDVSVVFRYDPAATTWTKIGVVSGAEYSYTYIFEGVCVGSTLYLFGRRRRNKFGDVLVLELDATLFERAAMVLWQDRQWPRQVRSMMLPTAIIRTMTERRTFPERGEE